jgi:YbgC/YbaW family acyl-CoA thioester hydrolase
METETRVPFVSRQRVHFDMLDLLGMLHNAAYLLLFERARTDFWRAHGLSKNVEGLDWPYYVARNEIDYRAPITTEQEVSVTVWVSGMGRSSVTFAHEVFTEEGVRSNLKIQAIYFGLLLHDVCGGLRRRTIRWICASLIILSLWRGQYS